MKERKEERKGGWEGGEKEERKEKIFVRTLFSTIFR